LEPVNFHMVEAIKEKNLEQGLQKTLDRAIILQEPVLFSYSFRFEVRDLLPILTHPSDKNTIRIYWEQPFRDFLLQGSKMTMFKLLPGVWNSILKKIKPHMMSALNVECCIYHGVEYNSIHIVSSVLFHLYTGLLRSYYFSSSWNRETFFEYFWNDECTGGFDMRNT